LGRDLPRYGQLAVSRNIETKPGHGRQEQFRKRR
jgi:hypothetical protein